MNNIVLTVDSGICAKRKEDTIVIPAQLISSDGITYCDNGTISNKQILKDMKCGIIYKTSSPLLGDYEDTFRSILEQKKDVIHLSMSSGISEGSVNSANVVASELNDEYENKVYVIDSLTGATGGTLIYEYAYNKIMNSSLSVVETVNLLNELKTRLHTSFYVPDASGYLRSGRDKTGSHVKDSALLLASKLVQKAMFKFRVDFHESGDLHFQKVFRSSAEKGMEKMVAEIVNKENMQKYDSNYVALGTVFKEKVDMEQVKWYLNSLNYFENIVEQEIGSVVAAYGCHDLCGIALVKKPK